MNIPPDPAREMTLLEHIEHNPDVTQASLATQLGVAVGTVNWHLKRMIAKGYVKVKRAERRKLRYIITPDGIAFRARLTIDYIEQSMLLYRHTRKHVGELLAEVKQAGYDSICIENASQADQPADIADICRLTCLEQGIQVIDNQSANHTPLLVVRGTKITLTINPEHLQENNA
ncbi:MAG TPA: winged helix-turn-helix transcriptional regulator [Anaerolineales bacterium]|nr:winged helix-turn-helix transcriptional regulator [Anaerolineales bacterium]